jgi:hypothetical protein
MKYTKEEIKQAYVTLKKYRGQEFGACIKSISRSRKSRRIEFYDNNFNRIGYYIARVIDYPYNIDKGGIKVDGCGMDMVFQVLSSLNYAFAKHDTGKSIQELLKMKECGKRTYDKYFTNADNYRLL